MREMKYIIWDTQMYYCPVLFHPAVEHAVMAALITANPGRIVSAGFVQVVDGKVRCYGKSTSLGLESRTEEDTRLIANLLLPDGMIGQTRR